MALSRRGSSAWGAGPGERVRVHLVTDLQASASPLRFADLQPPPGVAFDLVDAGAAQSANLRVAQAWPDEREAGVVRVRVEGDAAALAERTLSVEVNGVERGSQKLSGSALLPLTARFVVGELGEGEHRITARLSAADSLAADDAYHALVRRVEPRVLLVAANVTGDDALYLRAALESLGTPKFKVELATAASLATRSLAEFAAVVVSDAGVMNAAGERELRRYLENGGAALLTLGPRTLQRGVESITDARLAGGRARAAGNAPARVAMVEQSHPVLRDPAGWRAIRFQRHVPLQATETSKVLMAFENGTPLLLEQALGRGRVLVFAAPLARDWNDLAIHPLFVRFVGESTGYLAGARVEAATALVGATIDANLSGRGGVVFDPQGRRVRLLGGMADSPRFSPEMPGFHEVRGGGRSDYIAVNIDPRESVAARLDAAAVDRWLALRPAAATATPTEPGADPDAAGPGASRLVPVWYWLLLAAALLAFLEPLMANYHLPILRERRP